MQRGDEIILDVETLSGDGTTVARKDGMVFFLDGAVPGDTVRALLRKVKKNFAEATTVEVLSPSPRRVLPACAHFGVCGGCRWQDLAYDGQLEFKHRRVADAFARIGGIGDVEVRPVIGCGEPFHYRNKMEFTFSNRRWLTEEEFRAAGPGPPEVALGLHRIGRYDGIVNIDECWLQSPVSSAILRTVREVSKTWGLTVYSTETHTGYLRHLVIREGKHTGEVMINLVTTTSWPETMRKLTALLLDRFPALTTVVNNITERKSMVAVGEREEVYHGPGFIREKLGEYTFHISANSFFQTNTLQAERLYNCARELAGLSPSDVVYDLYTGTGTIAIFMSESVERVIGIETVPSAIADAERNAQSNRIANCYFLLGDLKELLTRKNEWRSEHPAPTVVLTDPPRSGMHATVVEQIARLGPDRIVYVSCNPATQARDARLFVELGYRPVVVQPVDMFPHTDHIEAVALFRRSSGG